MKCRNTLGGLVLAVILAALLVAFPLIPTYVAAEDERITFYPDEGKIGDKIDIVGEGFDEDELFYIYLSSDVADEGDNIDDEVTHYKQLKRNVRSSSETSSDPGRFDTYFIVPEELNDGEDEEDVIGADYYVYVTYRISRTIIAFARFTVIDGEIELDAEDGTVGTEIRITGEGLRGNQEIVIKYDADEVDIMGGDISTDDDGEFISTFIIPESTAGSHTVTVTDESGNKPEAGFSVKPKITLGPSSQAIDEEVEVSGTGFGDREHITIVFGGGKVFNVPITLHTSLRTSQYGSFRGSLSIPPYPAYVGGGTGRVAAYDESLNVAEAELTVLPMTAGIRLQPTTSQISPGHVGMDITVNGTCFIADSLVNITYDNGQAITVATVTTNDDGNFSVAFTVPSSVAGGHAVTATDGSNSVTSIFTMESEAPPLPMALLTRVADTAEGETYFDWEDVTDPSDITYILQIGADDDITTKVFEKKGLIDSEYTLTEEERSRLIEKEITYYWRVKAVDGAFNESEWTPSKSFRIGFSRISIPTWATYVWIGLGCLMVVIIVRWVRRRKTE